MTTAQGVWVYNNVPPAAAFLTAVDETPSVILTPTLHGTWQAANQGIVRTLDDSKLAIMRGTSELDLVNTASGGVSHFPLVSSSVFLAMAAAPDYIYVGTHPGSSNDTFDTFHLPTLTDTAQFSITGGSNFAAQYAAATTDGANLVVIGSQNAITPPPYIETVYIVRTPANTVVPVSGTDTPGTGLTFEAQPSKPGVIIDPTNTVAYVPFETLHTGSGITTPPYGIWVIDIASATITATISLSSPVFSMGLAAGSHYLYLTSLFSSVDYTIIDTSLNTVAATVATGAPGGNIAEHITWPNSNTSYVFGLASGAGPHIYVDVFDISTLSIVHTTAVPIGVSGTPNSIDSVVTLDGLKLFASTSGGSVQELFIMDTTSFVAASTGVYPGFNFSGLTLGPMPQFGGWHIGEAPIGNPATGGWRTGAIP